MREMTLKELHEVSLQILKDVHNFCVKNNINYSLSGGSLLGAIRHNGFIPWDVDIDIQLPQPDYYRFIHEYKSENGYRLFCYEVDCGCRVFHRTARVCDVEHTFVDQGPDPWIGRDVGVCIDIIPVYGAPNTKTEMLKHFKNLKRKSRIVNCWVMNFSKWKEIRKLTNKGKLFFVIKKILSVCFSNDSLTNLINEYKKFDFEKCDYMLAGTHNGMGEWQPKKNMESYILHKFEDSEFYIMTGYDNNLTGLFGDYMQMPPENKRFFPDTNLYYWR